MSVEDVRAEHRANRLMIVASRQQEKQTAGPLARAFKEVMTIWDRWRANGDVVSEAERVKGLEAVLRDAWPNGRTEDWTYFCSACDDYGLVIQECPGDATCGHVRKHRPHNYGTPCWCPRGKQFRPKAKATPEDFTSAGRTQKPRGMDRVGR